VRLQPGDRVEGGQPVGSIESMKILSPVQVPEGGEIVEVLVEDGQPVEYGHQLFLLRPGDGRESDGGEP
jgi:biotin carboxyl carrier protein